MSEPSTVPGRRGRSLLVGVALVALTGLVVGAGGYALAGDRDSHGAAEPEAAAAAQTAPKPGEAPEPGAASESGSAVAPASAAPVGPPARARFDYQIGGPYTPPSGVRVVSRDRRAAPAPGLYNVCYVNGFQTQPETDGQEGDNAWFQATPDRRNLLLRRDNGALFEDPDWPGEILFDIRTDGKRQALAAIVGRWIAGCAASGFNAVEIDNLDTFTRSFVRGSSGATYLSMDDAKKYATLLTAAAHTNGLAVAQKNTLELELDADGEVSRPDAGRQVGFDFGIVEECGQFSECGSYFEVWGSAMFVIEYSDANFRKACTVLRGKASVVRRDPLVTTPGSSTYRYNSC